MKEVIKITDLKVLDLLGDPFTMEILNTIEQDTVSKKWVAEKLGEKEDLISNYIDEMVKGGLLIKTDEGYRPAAKSFDAQGLMKDVSGNNIDWLRGFINYMENNVIEQFENLSKLREKDEKTADDYIDQMMLSHSQIYLSHDEVKEVIDFLQNFLENKESEGRKDDPAYKKFHLYNFFYPEIEE